MRDYDYENYGVSLSAPKYDRTKEAMPTREELIARNSFDGPDQNKYITTAAHRQNMAAKRKREEAIAKETAKGNSNA